VNARYATSLFLAPLFAAWCSCATAQTIVPTTSAAASPPTVYSPVKVDDRKIFDISGGLGISAAERAVPINHRLEHLVERPTEVPPFSAKDLMRREGQTLLTLGGEPVLTVTEDDAKEELTNRDELALNWGEKLSDAVAVARSARANPFKGVGLLVRNTTEDMLVSGIKWLPRLVGAILVWTLFWFLARIVRMVTKRVTQAERLDSNIRQLIRSTSFYGTWVVGGIIILTTLGLDSSSIATGIGISGFAIGFAFKDILSHLFAGLMLLTGRQFHIGDQIVVKEYEGTVERIELRALYLRTYDNRLVIIPNGDVFTSTVTSNTASSVRRREIIVGVSYQDDLAQAQKVALDTVRTVPGVAEDPVPDVLVDELTSTLIKLRIRFYTNSQRSDYLKVGSECMGKLTEAFIKSGISLPNGKQSIVIDNLDTLKPGVSAALDDNAVKHEHTTTGQAHKTGASS
jgi:small-conductance mechanosensitive channel